MKPVLVALSLALTFSTSPGAGKEDLFAEVCSKCHGEKGQGNYELKAPSIAGQPDWYILAQLEKFRTDKRGIDPKDPTGSLMHAVALQLDKKDMRKVAAHVTGLPAIPTADTLKGDTIKGRQLFEENCMECHRFNGRGERAFKSAQLITLQDWYIVGQLKKFRTGLRGAHPEDEEGAKMHRVTGFIESEDDFVHIAAFIAVLARKYAN